MTDALNLGAAALASAVQSRTVSAVEITRASLDRIRSHDGDLHSCTAVLGGRALADAALIDARIAAGETAGPLAGVPFVVKNLFDVDGVTTIAGAQMLRDDPPAQQDATIVRRLKAAGAVLIATTNMDEFAYGFTTENRFYGTTRNPRDLTRVAGGSSGGSAAAVAAGFAHIGLGSDTNGSIRVPASFSGVYGLKPTFGRLSRAGAFPFVASLDHVGPMARTVADLALSYDVMQGADDRDPACTDREPELVARALEGDPGGLRVGVLDGWFRRGAQGEVLNAVDAAARALGGGALVSLEDAEMARAAAFLITASEGGALHLDRLRERPEAFDPATLSRLIAGALLPAAMLIQAQRFRRRFQVSVRRLFERFDILLAPATPCEALGVDQKTLEIGGVSMLARAHVGLFTQPFSFVGLPIVVAPILREGRLPIGVQIVAAPWQEAKAFRAAAILERAGISGAPIA